MYTVPIVFVKRGTYKVFLHVLNNILSISVNTVTETDIIENITRVYQNNITSQEEQDESKTTLVDFPFSVSIQKKGAHYVSGALIGPDWVLSVAGEFFK